MRVATFLLLSVLTLGAEPTEEASPDLNKSLTQLGDEDYYVREQSMIDLVAAASKDVDTVLAALVGAEKSPQPEIRLRASATLERIFMRRELGHGAPKHGLLLKPKLVTINKKLKTRPLISKIEPNSAAATCKLAPGDLILSINGIHFDNEDSIKEITTYLNKQQPGSKLEISYSRKIEGKSVIEKAALILGKPSKPADLLPDQLAAYHIWHSNLVRQFDP